MILTLHDKKAAVCALHIAGRIFYIKMICRIAMILFNSSSFIKLLSAENPLASADGMKAVLLN